jgi:cobalt-zinc-cadmium efflux system outer membrane protein
MMYIINYRSKYIVILSLILTSSILYAQNPLEVYQDTAALNNPGIQALYKQYEVVMQKVPQSSSLPDPTFGIGYFISATETRVGPTQAVMSISQSFPWFGQLNAQEDATIERALAVLEKYNGQRSRLNFDVANTYNSLYVLRSAIRLTAKNIELLQTFKDLARVRYESGKGSMVDVLRIEMELDELKNQLEYLKDSKSPLTTQFEQLLNTNIEQDIVFPEVLWDEKFSLNKELILDSVTTMNPAILSLNHELLSYDQDVIAAKKTGGPSFTVGLNYTIVGQREGYTGSDNGRDAILPTIGVKIPLYRKNYDALVKEKEIARESVVLKKIDRTNILHTSFEKGIRDYDDAVRRIALFIELGEHAMQAMDILISEYTSASTNFEEIIRMDRKLLKYQLELEKARADQNTSVAFINYLMGK